ncbi:MAG: hypothetical protein MJB14_14760, partial [Spirochaetes bacterium]|nr:hypothetical protein [Spirochaetota bacterium]
GNEILDYNDQEKVIAYEKFLYESFKDFNHEVLKDSFFIDNGQLKQIEGYNDYDVYVCWYQNEIVASMAINKNVNTSHLLKYDFDISLFQKPYCEGRHFSALGIKKMEAKGLDVIVSFTKYVLNHLRKSYQYVYGTCKKDLLRFYNLIGFREIQMITYKKEERYLLELDLNNSRF